jgi:hypothetical protein
MLLALFAPRAFGVHDDGVFELDRNAIDQAAPGEDWNKVCPASTPAGIAPGCLGGTTADASKFIVDAVNAAGKDTTLYTGGSTKDDLDTPGWKFTSGAGPDKDDISDGYAARYGDRLYFGLDRFSASGDSTVGAWFFQNDVGPITSGADAGSFGPDAHADGDVLVLSDFTKGGEATTIRVFEWNGPGGSIAGSGAIDGTLDLLSGSLDSPADCVGPPTVGSGDNACATVNTTDTDSPWKYQAKEHGSTANKFPKGHFYEGGIDLQGLGLGGECFASFVLETRASQSTDSVLKDFVADSFASCGATMATTPSQTSFVLGGSVTDAATITVTGPTSPPAPTGDVDFYVCGPPATSCDATGTNFDSQDLAGATQSGDDYTVTSDAFTPTAAGTYCFFATWAGDTHYPDGASDNGSDECFTVNQLQPTISTAQSFVPNDSATIDVATGGGDLNGTLRFRLYDNSICADPDGPTGLLYDSNVAHPTGIAVSGAAPQTRSTDNTTAITTTQTGLSWLVEYTNSNPAHQGVTSSCHTENASLTINNG